MKITDCPCENCQKRTAECHLRCSRYKVYRYNKEKEYAKRKEEMEIADAYYSHIIRNSERRRKRNGYGKFNQKRRKFI